MATFNYERNFRVTWLLFLGIWLAAGFTAAASETTKNFAAQTEAEFNRAQRQFQSNTNNVAAAWKFARACFDFADFATNGAKRAATAREGIAACRQALGREPDSAPAHYYLGLNQGQLARAETLGALRLVRQMEHEFNTADGLDAQFDYAGSARALGLLYRDAPGWPASIGSRRKALDWLKQAETIAPDYPENHLNLLESYLQWHEPAEAEQELQELDAVWPDARKKLIGADWERSWADWSARRDAARERLTSRPEKSKNGH